MLDECDDVDVVEITEEDLMNMVWLNLFTISATFGGGCEEVTKAGWASIEVLCLGTGGIIGLGGSQ